MLLSYFLNPVFSYLMLIVFNVLPVLIERFQNSHLYVCFDEKLKFLRVSDLSKKTELIYLFIDLHGKYKASAWLFRLLLGWNNRNFLTYT